VNAIAHALAHGGPNACRAGTAHAKTREGKAQHNTAPQGKFFGVETSTTSSGTHTREIADEVVEQ
jgi:hypothetical protein